MSRTKWFVFGLAVLCLSCCLLLPCVQQARDGEGWIRSAGSVQQITEALRLYHEVHGRLPRAVVRGKDGQPLYSWRVLLLPYVAEKNLYDQFHLDEAWDSPHNRQLLQKTPRSYMPALGGDDPPGLTRYQVFVGPGTAFERDGLTWDDFPDGLSDTLLVAEASEPVPWSKPADLAYDPAQPVPLLGGLYNKPVHFLCYRVGSKAGFNAGFADGRVRFLRSTTDEQTIRGFITRDGGEKVDASKSE